MWDELALQVVELLLPIVVALLVALIGYGVAYLRQKTQEINNKIARESLDAALAEAEIVAINAVQATKQTLVDELKARSEDGKLTRQEALEAIEAAKKRFLASISKDSLNVLIAALGPVETWLENLLEAKVAEIKQLPLSS